MFLNNGYVSYRKTKCSLKQFFVRHTHVHKVNVDETSAIFNSPVVLEVVAP